MAANAPTRNRTGQYAPDSAPEQAPRPRPQDKRRGPSKQERKGRTISGVLGFLLVSGLAGGAAWIKHDQNEHEKALESVRIEGDLKNLGFSDKGIGIDLNNHSTLITFVCQDVENLTDPTNGKPTTYYYNKDDQLAYLKIEPVTDAEGREREPGKTREFDLDTKDHVAKFITGELAEMCAVL